MKEAGGRTGTPALPTGSKRTATFLLFVAFWGLYTFALGADDVSASGQRRVVAAYIAHLAKGAWARSVAGTTDVGNGTTDAGSVPPLVGTPAKSRPGIGVRAHPAAKANPQNVIMTMIAGNGAARHAVALVQSLRDVGTKADAIIVMLQQGGMGSPECYDPAWRRANNRPDILGCSGPDSIAEEIVSPFYLNILKRLGAVLMVTPELERTEFTRNIAGGAQTYWGMSMNKMQIFNMTQFKKIIFVDSDTLMFQNIDHLFGPEYPMFTAALTYDCCNRNGPPVLSGGFWIVEPSLKWGLRAWELMVQGMPERYGNGTQMRNADGSLKFGTWRLSDLDLARAMFAASIESSDDLPLWPGMDDLRHGYVPGLRMLPEYSNMTDAEFSLASRNQRRNKVELKEGFQADKWDGVTPVWHSLDLRYDQCVGMCECLPGRDLRERYISIHYSCIQGRLHKPGWYSTEVDLMRDMYTMATSCTRHYFLERYYAALVKAGARLDPPYWEGPPVPIWNETHDVIVRAHIKELKKQNAW